MSRFCLLFVLSLLPLTGCHSDTKSPAASSPHASMSSSESPSGDAPSSENDDASSQNVSLGGSIASTNSHDPRPVIVAFGDSLTAGYGTNIGESYPDALQRDLDKAGYHYRVVNAGVSGETTKDGVNRLSAVLALHPQVVIVAFGGNDGLRGLPIASSRENLTTIVSTLQKSGVKVLLGGITLPPNYGADYIRQFNDTYALLAKEFHTPLLPFLLKGVYGVPGGMQGDGLHATASGNETVAKNLLPLLTPMLKKN